jgi:hypothetical protein
MAVNKNFVVKNGLEVKSNLLVADTATNSVGIGTSVIEHKLHVQGGIGATALQVSGIGTVDVAIGGTARFDQLYAPVGVVTSLSGTLINVSGAATAGSFSVGANQVVSSTRQLQNISSLDGSTTNVIRALASGIGIRTEGGVIGYGATFLNFVGAGVSSIIYNSAVGIATIDLQGGGGGGGGSVSIGTEAPTTPLPNSGDLWYSTDLARTFVYYDEVALGVGSSAFWVDAAPYNQSNTTMVSRHGSTMYAGLGLTAGTAAAPGLYINGSSNTGLFSSSASQIAVGAGGAGIATFSSGGIIVSGASTISGDVSIGRSLTVVGNMTVGGDLKYDEATAANWNVTGIATAVQLDSTQVKVTGFSTFAAASFSGDVTGNITYAKTAGVSTVAGIATYTSEWTLGADGTSHYTFSGPGLTGAENDPTIYLVRGQQYKFKNRSGGHPFRIQSTVNGSTGTAFNDGITNNDAANGTDLLWNVQQDTPATLYYQCTSHGNMGGKINILDVFDNNGNNLTGVSTNFTSAIGISSAGLRVGVGITQLNFVGTGNTFLYNGATNSIDISISGGGGGGVSKGYAYFISARK